MDLPPLTGQLAEMGRLAVTAGSRVKDIIAQSAEDPHPGQQTRFPVPRHHTRHRARAPRGADQPDHGLWSPAHPVGG